MRTITTIPICVLLAGVMLAGCSATDGVKTKANGQAVTPPDAVIFINGMS